MAQKKKPTTYGPIYQHAKAELERAGVTGKKGQLDQKIFHTTLKLVHVYEQAGPSDLTLSTISNLFNTLSQGELINKPTNDPDEWEHTPSLGEDIYLNKRCQLFISRDGGKTWQRPDTGSYGVSVDVTKEEEQDDANEENSEDVQPKES